MSEGFFIWKLLYLICPSSLEKKREKVGVENDHSNSAAALVAEEKEYPTLVRNHTEVLPESPRTDHHSERIEPPMSAFGKDNQVPAAAAVMSVKDLLNQKRASRGSRTLNPANDTSTNGEIPQQNSTQHPFGAF